MRVSVSLRRAADVRRAAMLLACAAAAAACASHDAAPLFTASVPYVVDTLDPHGRDLVGQLAIGAHLYDPLVCKDAEMALRPCLALRWFNPDPLTWVFVLRPGVRFHDGRLLSAEDVVYTFDRLRADPRLQVGVYAEAVQSARAVAPLTVELRTARPVAALLHKLALVPIVPRGSTGPELMARPCGTGPYRFVEWRKGASLDLARNDDYWGPKPALARVRFRLGRSAEEATSDVVSGGSQLAHTGGGAPLAGRPEVQVVRRTGILVTYLGFDTARTDSPYVSVRPNPFLLREVREAVSLAIDRSALVAALPGGAAPASQMVAATIFGFDPALPQVVPDLARARGLLAAAGLPRGFEATLHARRVVGEGAPQIAAMLAAAGIRVRVLDLSEPEFFAAIAEPPSFFLNRYGCDTGDASDVLLAGLHSPDPARRLGMANAGRWSDPEMDAAIERSAEELDAGSRRRRLHEVLRRAARDLPWVPLYYGEEVYVLRAPWRWRPRADSYVLAAEVTRAPD